MALALYRFFLYLGPRCLLICLLLVQVSRFFLWRKRLVDKPAVFARDLLPPLIIDYFKRATVRALIDVMYVYHFLFSMAEGLIL